MAETRAEYYQQEAEKFRQMAIAEKNDGDGGFRLSLLELARQYEDLAARYLAGESEGARALAISAVDDR